MGGGGHYDYPKHVWSPSGGWWSQPRTWKRNTAVVSLGIALTVYTIWSYSAENEKRSRAPTAWIPSMMWSKQFKTGEVGIREV